MSHDPPRQRLPLQSLSSQHSAQSEPHVLRPSSQRHRFAAQRALGQHLCFFEHFFSESGGMQTGFLPWPASNGSMATPITSEAKPRRVES